MAATPTKQAAKTVRGARFKRAAAAILGREAEKGANASSKVFSAWCVASVSQGGLATIVGALYYLPQNFMLMIPRATAEGSELTSAIKNLSMANRVQFYEQTDSSADGSFWLADAVIDNETSNSVAVVPATQYNELAAKEFSFETGLSPEAIASALLNIFREA